MRQIKFKVWDIGKKVFIPSDVYALTFNTDSQDFGVMIKNWENYQEGEYFYENSQLPVEYTGRDDINGTPIYEGDIIRHGESIRFIECRDCRWLAIRPCKTEAIMLSFSESPVVIGNIYENPELLTSTTN